MNANESQYHLLFHFYPYISHSLHSHYHILLHFNHFIRPLELLLLILPFVFFLLLFAMVLLCAKAATTLPRASNDLLIAADSLIRSLM